MKKSDLLIIISKLYNEGDDLLNILVRPKYINDKQKRKLISWGLRVDELMRNIFYNNFKFESFNIPNLIDLSNFMNSYLSQLYGIMNSIKDGYFLQGKFDLIKNYSSNLFKEAMYLAGKNFLLAAIIINRTSLEVSIKEILKSIEFKYTSKLKLGYFINNILVEINIITKSRALELTAIVNRANDATHENKIASKKQIINDIQLTRNYLDEIYNNTGVNYENN